MVQCVYTLDGIGIATQTCTSSRWYQEEHLVKTVPVLPVPHKDSS